MYAEIIVDVNNHNVNQSFYYIIPKEFENEDIVGYRVEVPFGTRIVQGYVTNIFEKYTGDADISIFCDNINFIIITTKTNILFRYIVSNYII